MTRTAVAAAMAVLIAAAAHADPLPREMLGVWSDQPGCGKANRRMVLGATSVTIVQSDGRRKSVQVDATGSAGERLEMRVTKVLTGEAEDPAGAHVGDAIAMRLDHDQLHFIGHADAGAPIQDDPAGPVLHRCKS